MKFGDIVVRNRRIIMITALILLVPSVLGMIATRINYDMLYYLPEDIETVQGQNVLLDEFGKGGFSIVVVEDMKSGDVALLARRISEVDHVDSVINLDKPAPLRITHDLFLFFRRNPDIYSNISFSVCHI